MSITKKHVGALAAAAIAVLITGCQIDTTTPMMVSQIRAVADTGAPSSVMASVTAVFATKDWCQDEGVMAAEVLAKINLLIQPCIFAGGQICFDAPSPNRATASSTYPLR